MKKGRKGKSRRSLSRPKLLEDIEVDASENAALGSTVVGDGTTDAKGNSTRVLARNPWLCRYGRPEYCVSDEQTSTLMNDTLELLKADEELYVFGGALVRQERDQGGRMQIRHLDRTGVLTQMAVAADWTRKVGGKSLPVRPPSDVAQSLLSVPSHCYPFRKLRGISAAPFFRSDGTIVQKEGYDPDTEIIYDPPSGFTVPHIPDSPTSAEVQAAIGDLRDVLAEFPFVDESSQANAIAMLITPFLLSVIKGCRPICVITAIVMGSGKTLLAELCALISTGAGAQLYSVPDDEDEFRKQLTAIIISGAELVVWDNLQTVLDSGELGKALTAEVWADRILGDSRSVQLHTRAAWVVTGNNVRLGGDIPRRTYVVKLDAKVEKPYLRTGFKYTNLKRHVLDDRGKLVAAILTMIRAWFSAGQPECASLRLGGFEDWCRVVGGVLQHAGSTEFLANQQEVLDQGDSVIEEVGVLFEFLFKHFKGDTFTAGNVFRFINYDSPMGLDKARDLLPFFLQDVVETNGKFQMRLGQLFRKYEKRPFGPDALRVVRAGAKQGAVKWRFSKVPPQEDIS